MCEYSGGSVSHFSPYQDNMSTNKVECVPVYVLSKNKKEYHNFHLKIILFTAVKKLNLYACYPTANSVRRSETGTIYVNNL